MSPSTSRPTTASRASVETTEHERDGWIPWRGRRTARVTGPQGDLALVETRWLDAGVVVSDAEALDGRAETVTITRLSRTGLETGAIEHGYRLWDSRSDAIERFERIEVFDFDPAWVLRAVFEPVSEKRTIPFEHLRDNGATRELVVPGDIRFTLTTTDGTVVEHTIAAFDDGGRLLVPFADLTNRSDDDALSSYRTGRFLFVQRDTGDDAVDPGTAGTVILDFNRSYVPPCGFSPHYNCPLPPPQNRLDVAVTAGERFPVLREG